MKMPLKYGIPLLIALWLGSGYTDYGQGKTALMSLAMGVALWTAFSLPRPPRRRPEDSEAEETEPEETGQEGQMEHEAPSSDGAPSPTGAEKPPSGETPSPANGSGEAPPTNGSGKPINPARSRSEKN